MVGNIAPPTGNQNWYEKILQYYGVGFHQRYHDNSQFPKTLCEYYNGLYILCLIHLDDQWYSSVPYPPKKGRLTRRSKVLPNLFFIGIECLSRILNLASNTQGFDFQPRCKGIRLTHLCFPHDIILFYKGNTASIKNLHQDLWLFSESSDLCG